MHTYEILSVGHYWVHMQRVTMEYLISISFGDCILVIGKLLIKLTNYRKRRTYTRAWVWQTNRIVFNDTNYVSFQWRDWPYVSNLGCMCYVVCNHECKYRVYKPNKGHLMSFKFNFLWNKSRVGKVPYFI